MNQIFKKTALSVTIALLMTPMAYATNGMAPTGLGQVHKAMGGAAVGNPQNTTTIMTNPAAASFIDDGYDVGLELFQPKRTATSNVPNTIAPAGTSYTGDGRSIFLIPELGYKKDKGQYSFGITAYGNGGMNTKYDVSPAFPAGPAVPPALPPGAPMNAGAGGPTGINLEQMFITPTVSRKINDKHSIGLSVNLVRQKFKAYGIQAFAGDPRANPLDLVAFTNPGYSTSTGIGATVGWMGKISDTFTVGASYRFKTKMSAFKKYKGLFAEGGKLHIPAALTIGAAFKVSPKTTIAVDVQDIFYSDVKAIANSASSPAMFGSSGGPGFGWNDDQIIVKLGVKTQRTPKLALMAGLNHGKSPIEADNTFFNVLAPGTVENHLSLGFEYALSKNSKVNGSFTHTFGNTVKGDPAQRQFFDLDMEQNAIGIGYSKTF